VQVPYDGEIDGYGKFVPFNIVFPVEAEQIDNISKKCEYIGVYRFK